MIRVLFFLCMLHYGSFQAQDKEEAIFGEPTRQERDLKFYAKDPKAPAVVLFERGKVSVIFNSQRDLVLQTEVHIKKKVFDSKKFGDNATVDIVYYHSKKSAEKLLNLKAVTINGELKTYVANSQMYTKDIDEHKKMTSFAFSNLQDGSIIEYSYVIESPFFFTYGWIFQGTFPVIYSEFVSEIPGNYEYRAALGGTKDFDFKNSYIKKNCFSLDGYGDAADCVYSEFVMRDVPAFKEEDYTLSKDNYISKIKYDLKETISFTGEKTFYTKTWKDVDKEFRFDSEIGRQLKFSSYFKNNLPQDLFEIQNPLERAKAVYYYIQQNFTWNGEYAIYQNIDVKKAYENKGGNIAEINLMLLNALDAADIKAHLVLSATRDFGLPTLIYPTLTEYDYVMAYLTLENQEYYLDATNKFTPFGVVPFKALNKIARIMDFKNESYWHPIQPNKKNLSYVNAKLIFDKEGSLKGTVEENNTGYFAVSKREAYFSNSKEEYIRNKEQSFVFFEISNLEIENLRNNEETVKETFNIVYEDQLIGDEIFLNPFFLSSFFNVNPFTLEERNYNIEMGYPFNQILLVNITIDEVYEISHLPKNTNLKLPNNAGTVSVVYVQNGNTVNIRFNLSLEEVQFEPEFYNTLKAFFSKVIELKTKTPIVLKKR